jgi:hypothetical protein
MVHGLLLTDSTKDSTNQKIPSYTSSDYSSLGIIFQRKVQSEFGLWTQGKRTNRLVDACRLMISLQMSEPLAASNLEHLQRVLSM